MYKSYIPYLQHVLDECLYVRSVIKDETSAKRNINWCEQCRRAPGTVACKQSTEENDAWEYSNDSFRRSADAENLCG